MPKYHNQRMVAQRLQERRPITPHEYAHQSNMPSLELYEVSSEAFLRLEQPRRRKAKKISLAHVSILDGRK